MARRAQRPCTYLGCGALHRNDGSRCDDHLHSSKRDSDAARGSSAQRGYGYAHRKWRKMVLRRHPVCRCGQVATVADHITPITKGGESLALANGQGLCEPCHNRKTQEEDGGQVYGRARLDADSRGQPT